MSLGACRECGGQVSSAAKICPKCGIKKPVKSRSTGNALANVIIAIKNNPKKSIAIFLILVIIGARAPNNQNKISTTVQTSGKTESSVYKIFNCSSPGDCSPVRESGSSPGSGTFTDESAAPLTAAEACDLNLSNFHNSMLTGVYVCREVSR